MEQSQKQNRIQVRFVRYEDLKLIVFIFRGAVTVSMDIEKLDINQCPGEYYTPNAFKRTHKCDDKTSYVSYQLIIN